MSATLQTVHLRVNDAATGQPTPVRIRCTGPDGTYYAPFGRLQRLGVWDCEGNVRVDGKLFAYIDGACEIQLPVGPVHIEIHKGPEYLPFAETIRLGPGKLALRLAIQRWTDERTAGWFSGELGAHNLTPHGALLEGAGEDLAVVNLLAEERPAQDGRVVQNLLAFSGQQPALALPGHLVVVNTLNAHDLLGRLALLNAHRVVYPLCFGCPQDNWTLADWCDQCHRKGGLVVWVNFWPWPMSEGRPVEEALADLILGKIDAVCGALEQLRDWYALLNCGLRAPLCEASSRRKGPLGRVRTYARLRPGEDLTYSNWIEAIRAGRTYATEGPLMALTVDGQEPGGRVTLPAAKRTVHVQAQARSLTAFDRLELVANGGVVASSVGSGSPCTATLDQELAVDQHGWLAARCWHDSAERPVAHTSPVLVRLEDRPVLAPRFTVLEFIKQFDLALAWVIQFARCDTDAQRQRLAAVFRQAREVLDRLPTA